MKDMLRYQLYHQIEILQDLVVEVGEPLREVIQRFPQEGVLFFERRDPIGILNFRGILEGKPARRRNGGDDEDATEI